MAGGDAIAAEANFKGASHLAEDARAAYAKLNTEVKEGDRVVISGGNIDQKKLLPILERWA